MAPFELSEAVSVEEPEAKAAFGGEDARAKGDWRPPMAESMEPPPDGVVQLEAHQQQARRAADGNAHCRARRRPNASPPARGGSAVDEPVKFQ